MIRQPPISGFCYQPLYIPYHRLTGKDDEEMSVWMSGMGVGGGSGGDGKAFVKRGKQSIKHQKASETVRWECTYVMYKYFAKQKIVQQQRRGSSLRERLENRHANG